jgi:flavin reductase (DIM6/NTAB) family NADH-FMN oxidoreductase RutF
MEIFTRFGYQSGKNLDKLGGMDLRYGETGVPVVLNESVAILECRLVQTVEVDTHILFIGELVHSELLDPEAEPITYLHYRQVKKARAPKNAPTFVDRSKYNSG